MSSGMGRIAGTCHYGPHEASRRSPWAGFGIAFDVGAGQRERQSKFGCAVLCGRGADYDAVDTTRPADRARRFDRQLRIRTALRPGELRAAQLPHDGGMIGELALKPRGGNYQFRAPGLLAGVASVSILET